MSLLSQVPEEMMGAAKSWIILGYDMAFGSFDGDWQYSSPTSALLRLARGDPVAKEFLVLLAEILAGSSWNDALRLVSAIDQAKGGDAQ